MTLVPAQIKSPTSHGNRCLEVRSYYVVFSIKRIPLSRKTNHTILIYKKGDIHNPANWRPISLQNSIYKIYTAILANRLGSWYISTKTISPMQKGFFPYEGCYEYSFLMQSVLDSKRQKKDLRIVWFDLKNAFGSIPHNKIFEMMQRLGVDQNFIDLCKDIHHQSSFKIHLGNTFTNDIYNANDRSEARMSFQPYII